MEDRTCLKCTRPLFMQGRDWAFERVCCRAPFHRQCIGNAEMKQCPVCQGNTDSMGSALIWTLFHRPKPLIAIVTVNDSEEVKGCNQDETSTCAICLEEGTMADRLLTTDCCNQRAHVSCLRRYYNLPAISHREIDRDTIVRKLGLPNCFVCRMDEWGMRPLTRSVLNATLPKVDDLRWWSGVDATRAAIGIMIKLKQLTQYWLR